MDARLDKALFSGLAVMGRPGAVDTSGHDSLDEWTNVLVLYSSLAAKFVVREP